jgi:UDPglucose--hexose-1-phosphate uridylyltransferase
MDKTEWRMDPLSREWTIFNESRALPPTFGPAAGEPLASSPFRAGLERYAPHALHHEVGAHGWQVRVVPNRAPILRVEGDHSLASDGPYERLDGIGAHEIVIEDPADRRFEDLSNADMAKVLSAWRVRIEDLMRDIRLCSFTVVKDTGRAAGQTIGHSISQLFAMAVIPAALRRKLEAARDYYAAKRRSLFADVLAEEKRRAARIVYENPGCVVFCPYAARSPFEMAVWPKRQSPDFHHTNWDELLHFADALRIALGRMNRALGNPAWHFALTTAPSRALHAGEWQTVEEDFRWHASIVPRLHPATGFEMATGCHVNGVWPEVAADFLRQQEVKP